MSTAVWLIGDNDNAGPAMSEKRAYLALLLNTLSAARLTEALKRTIGQEYLASTCADIYAIVRVRGNRRESAKGPSWADALDKAKHKWGWDFSQQPKQGGRRG